MSAQSWGMDIGVQIGRLLGAVKAIESTQREHATTLREVKDEVREIRGEWEATKHWLKRVAVLGAIWGATATGALKADAASDLAAGIIRKLIGF